MLRAHLALHRGADTRLGLLLLSQLRSLQGWLGLQDGLQLGVQSATVKCSSPRASPCSICFAYVMHGMCFLMAFLQGYGEVNRPADNHSLLICMLKIAIISLRLLFLKQNKSFLVIKGINTPEHSLGFTSFSNSLGTQVVVPVCAACGLGSYFFSPVGTGLCFGFVLQMVLIT